MSLKKTLFPPPKQGQFWRLSQATWGFLRAGLKIELWRQSLGNWSMVWLAHLWFEVCLQAVFYFLKALSLGSTYVLDPQNSEWVWFWRCTFNKSVISSRWGKKNLWLIKKSTFVHVNVHTCIMCTHACYNHLIYQCNIHKHVLKIPHTLAYFMYDINVCMYVYVHHIFVLAVFRQ